MAMLAVDELRPGHFVRQGSRFAHVVRPPYEANGYVEVPTDAGLWRFPPAAEVFVAATEPLRSA